MSEICVDACAYYRKNGKCSIPHYANGVKFTGCNCADWECSFKSLHRTLEDERVLVLALSSIEHVIGPYKVASERDIPGLPATIESILARQQADCKRMLAEKNALQIGYDEYSNRIKVLEAELKRYKKYQELEKFVKEHDTSNEKQIAQKLFEAEQRIKSLENAQRLAIENITKVVKALNTEE